MAIKKYAFLSLALLTSMSKAFFCEDSCFKFYVGGDLGVGKYTIQALRGDILDTDNDDRVAADAICYTNSKTVFIGGGRLGLAWTGSECWYAAIEGNVHSASGCSSLQVGCNVNKGECGTTATYTDKTRYIAGVHAHFGYKAVEDGAIYGIVGYKYLRLERFTNFDWDSADDQQNFDNFGISSCLNNNGWAVGVGALMNLECNWDIRLEAIYAGFGTKCYSDAYEFKGVLNPDDDSFKGISGIQVKPSLFYGVVSLAYNF